MSILGGPECSAGVNPVNQFFKHLQDDKSLQRDRVYTRSPRSIREAVRDQAVSNRGDQMLEAFTQNPNQTVQGPAGAPKFMAMDEMRQALEQTGSSQGPVDWLPEFMPANFPPPSLNSESTVLNLASHSLDPSEFANYKVHHADSTFASSSSLSSTDRSLASRSIYHESGLRPLLGAEMGIGGLGMGMGMRHMFRPYGPMGMENPVVESEKKKSGIVELDDQTWEAQFQMLEGQISKPSETLADSTGIAPDPLVQELGELNSKTKNVDRSVLDGEIFSRLEEMENWYGFNDNFSASWRGPDVADYQFENENLFENSQNPYGEGIRILREGGNLSLAALAFESAVQRDSSHVDAWLKLGMAQAQNEKETPAIRALEKALSLDPENLQAMMALAVSYTNEGYKSTAFRTLEKWVSTKYRSLVTENTPGGSDSSSGSRFPDEYTLRQRVTDLFIRAAQLSPEGERMDPDVQVGLGVLFYGAEEYDKAVDCFSAALASSETGATNHQDSVHLLWNRLGATLANSGRSEEAIHAYERALELRPNFVRAIYNLGVSCINVGCLHEAAQHLLGALSMHQVILDQGREEAKDILRASGSSSQDQSQVDMLFERSILHNQSTNLVDTLRRVLLQMSRKDLADQVGPGMDLGPFRSEFEF